MKILVVTGINDRSEIALYRGMVQSGVDLEIACEPIQHNVQELEASGITILPLHIRHKLDIVAIKQIRKRLMNGGFDAFYALSGKALVVSMIASFGLKIVRVTYRGTCGHVKRWNPVSWLAYLNPYVDCIICVSNAVKRYLQTKGVPEEKLVTIYKGHDVAWYVPQEKRFLRGFGIPANAFVVCFAGTVRPVKGVDILLKAISSISESENIHCLIVGTLRSRRVKELARRIDGRIHFVGFRSDATALIGASDVFVMPSVAREGLPRAIIEAMSQRVPVIGTNVGGIPEIVTDGECGIIVPPGQPEPIAKAVVFLKRNPEVLKQMGINSQQKVIQNFNIERTIQETVSLFFRLQSKYGKHEKY